MAKNEFLVQLDGLLEMVSWGTPLISGDSKQCIGAMQQPVLFVSSLYGCLHLAKSMKWQLKSPISISLLNTVDLPLNFHLAQQSQYQVMNNHTKKTCRIHDCHQGAFTTENTPLLVNEIAYKKSNSMSCHKDNKRQTTKVCSLTDEESQKRGIHIKSLGYWQAELKPLLNVLFASLYGTGFLFAFTLLSAGGAVVENLVFLFYETMGSNFTVCGLSVLVTVVFELPIFVMAPFLLTWMGGPVRMLFWGTAAFIVRVTTYTLVPQGKFGWLLVIESLHGVSYAFYKTSGVEFMAKLATPGSEATAQGILNGLRGLGAVMGLSVAGWAQEIFGPRIMYRSFGAVNLLGLLVLLITERGENTTGITSLAISN